jgi:hypothetical protein
MGRRKKVRIPEKYEVWEPTLPPNDEEAFGERILLEEIDKPKVELGEHVEGNGTKQKQRSILLYLMGVVYVFVQAVSLLYAVYTGDKEVMKNVQEACNTIILIAVGYYFGSRNGKN